MKNLTRYTLLIIILLSFGLRLYRIDAQSLWNDEGTSIVLAGRSLAAITHGAAHDIHPPFYYYILHYWLLLAGTSEFAARSLSAFSGTLLVVLTFILARKIISHHNSIFTKGNNHFLSFLAALLVAISPFHIYYSQEVRTYIFTALLGGLSVYFFTRLLAAIEHSNDKTLIMRRAAPYLLSSIALIYTHYFAATIIFVENAVVALSQIPYIRKNFRRVARVFVTWSISQLIIIAAYVPWLRAAQNLRTWPAISEPQSLFTLSQKLLIVFSLGLSIPPNSNWLAWGFAALLLIGIIIALRHLRFTHCALLITYLFIPILTMYALSLNRPMYNPKFLLLTTPPFYILTAYGAVGIGKFTSSPLSKLISLALIGYCLIASGYSLHNYYYNSIYARDDYRAITEYITATAHPDDAILINAPGQQEVFRYYYRGDLAIYPLPQHRPLQEKITRRTLERIIAKHQRIYAVLWATDESDPQRFIEGWLDDHAYKARDRWYGNVRLAIYAAATAEAQQHALDVTFGERIRLRGYSLSPSTGQLSAGEILQLTLFWQATAPLDERYKIFVHILDQHNHIVGQHDAEPGGGARLTTLWQPSEVVTDNHGVLILPATPPGTHRIKVGLYSLENGTRLPVEDTGKDYVILKPIEIAASHGDDAQEILTALNIQYSQDENFDALTLRGYDQYKLGYDHDRAAPLHAGDILHLTLYWQAVEKPAADPALRLQLHKDKNAITKWDTTITEGQYPPTAWQAGEIVRDQHHLPLPTDLSPGQYHLTLRLDNSAPLKLAPFRIN